MDKKYVIRLTLEPNAQPRYLSRRVLVRWSSRKEKAVKFDPDEMTEKLEHLHRNGYPETTFEDVSEEYSKKICKVCKETKPREKFPTSGQLVCFACLGKKHRARNMEWAKKKYREDHEWREKYLLRCKEKRKRRQEAGLFKKYLESSVRRWLYSRTMRARTHANRSKFKYDLSLDFLCDLWEKQKGCCAISNLPMTTKFNSLYSCSIDRIDSTKGYTEDNVQLLCKAINYAKGHSSREEFTEFMARLKMALGEKVSITEGENR